MGNEEAPVEDPSQVSWWRSWAWWAVSVLVALLHNGLWATPNLGFMAHIAEHPGRNPFPVTLPGDYLLTSLSMPSLATVLGHTKPHEVARLHLLVLLVTWAGVVGLARHRFGHAVARNLTVLLAASPVVTVSMQWLGQPDPLTAMCGVAMVLVRRRLSQFALAVLAGLTHPEQAIFMAAIAAAVRILLPREEDAREAPSVEDPPATRGARTTATADDGSPRWFADATVSVAVALGGVLTGRLLTQVWFWIHDIRINVPRSEYIDSGIATFWDHHTQQPDALVWSLWGPLWLVILAAVWFAATRARRSGLSRQARRAALGLSALAGLALLPVFLTLDETRVYAVLSAPILAGLAVWFARALPGVAAVRGAAVLLALTALVPGVMATGSAASRGDLDTPAMLAFLRDGSVPARFEDPEEGPLITEWLIEPFDIVVDDPGS